MPAPLRVLLLLAALAAGATSQAAVGGYPGAIRLAIDQAIGTQKPSGLLLYGFDFLADRESEKDSLSAVNLTRQAYSAAILADFLERGEYAPAGTALTAMLGAFGRRSLPIGKSAVQAALENARVFVLPVGRFRLRSALERFGLLYTREGDGRVLSPDGDYSQAYTGATALALIAEVRYARATGDHRFADLRRGWLRALADLRIPGGGFRWLVTSIDREDYFDGEAWLALAEYRRAFPDDDLARSTLAAVDADMLSFYGREFRVKFFHWGTMAAAARYRDSKERRFLDFVRDQVREFVGRKKASHDDENHCAWVEGVADGLGALIDAGEGSGDLARDAREWIAREMAKAGKLQIRPGQRGIDFDAARVDAPRMREFAGAFLEGTYVPRTQVDVTFHCVSAMLKIERGKLLAPAK